MNLTLCRDFDKLNELVIYASKILRAKIYNKLSYDDFYQEGWLSLLKYFKKEDSIDEKHVVTRIYFDIIDVVRAWDKTRMKTNQLKERVELDDNDGVIIDNNHCMFTEDVRCLIELYGKEKNMILQKHFLEDMTLLEIANEFGLTESRICQIVGDFKRLCKRRLKDEILLYNK